MKTQIAAIEFGTSKIVTMIAQSGGMDRLDIIGSGTVPYDGYSDGDWNTPGQMIQRVGDSIAAATTFQTWPRGWFHIPKDPDFPVPS